jgi:hypothetical protein
MHPGGLLACGRGRILGSAARQHTCVETGVQRHPRVEDRVGPLGDPGQATIAQAWAGGQRIAVTYGRWAAAILDNGLGRYEEARDAALRERLAEPTRAGAPTSDWGSRLAPAHW